MMKIKEILVLVVVMVMTLTGRAQLPSSFPPKSYPASILVVTDPGVAKYWDVKRIMYLGPGNGGHKFRIFGSSKADHRAASVDIHYIRLDDKLQSAGAYFFPEVRAGEAFNFDIVSAYPGYSPTSFLGFMIKDDLFPAQEDKPEVPEEINNSIRATQGLSVDDAKDEIIATDNDRVYQDVEVGASFLGGIDSLKTFLASNVRYPEAALKKGVQGKVIVKFVVERNGTITQASILRSIDVDLDKEALRIVSRMPKWEPAKKNGQPVRSYYTLPVNFRLPSKK